MRIFTTNVWIQYFCNLRQPYSLLVRVATHKVWLAILLVLNSVSSSILQAIALAALMPGTNFASLGITERISVNSTGCQANGLTDRPSISADGRYVAFEGANASNLVPGDTNNVADVFVHDRETGVTSRVSVGVEQIQSNNGNAFAAISADGRYVAFQSIATNLITGDTNGQIDVFVHECHTGVTSRVSVRSGGAQVSIGGGAPAISGDGRYVAFMSPAPDLVVGDNNGTWDVFVHDRQTSVTTRVSVSSSGTQGNGPSTSPAISSNSRYVAFFSAASDLVPNDTNGTSDVFVHDRQTGITTCVSINSNGAQGNNSSGMLGSDHDSYISGDGRYVTFSSAASNLVADDVNGVIDVFVHDRQTGATTRVSANNAGIQANGDSFFPTISADGLHVAFGSFASNLVADDNNGVADVFVHDRQTGTTSRVSVSSTRVQGNNHSSQGDGGFEAPVISSDGRYVAFASAASNLVPGDSNGWWDVFVHDRNPGATVVTDNPRTPSSFLLEQNYPNPFNPATTIKLEIPVGTSRQVGTVSLRVYDALGREVATLVNEEMKPGSYEVKWDATGLSSGVYFYRLKTGGFVETKKMILLR